jgi:hypothetical protein
MMTKRTAKPVRAKATRSAKTVRTAKPVHTADSFIFQLMLNMLKELHGSIEHLRERVLTPVAPGTKVDMNGLDEAAQEKKVTEHLGLHLRQYLAFTSDSLSEDEAKFLTGLFNIRLGKATRDFPIGGRVSFPYDDSGKERQLKGFVVGAKAKDPLLLVVDDDGKVGVVKVAKKIAKLSAGQYVPGPPPA